MNELIKSEAENYYEINKKLIKALNPCADRYENYLRRYSDFNGAIEEFLFLPEISHADKLWVSLRLLPRGLVEVFAIDCAVSAQNYAAANAAHSAYSAYAAYAAYAANAADAAVAYAANAVYAAYAVYAVYAANATDTAVAYAVNATYAAYAAASEEERQIEALIWLFNSKEI
jgi:hypothetical protein